MKTTLQLDDRLASRLEREAARQGRTTSEVVEMALRLLFRAPLSATEIPDLPSFDCGGSRVDIADRSALCETMEGR